ncbi:MAG TPA: cytochrome c oxidase subunit 3 [Salinimicrobium sp.]|nr:cytochrome c oxidase subunit 3 [Salinimicrobium sp.]
MDLTEGTNEYKFARAKKMMLWFGIISMAMMFAGLTSAYVVSKSRPDWLTNLELPNAFFWSTLVIILSSISLILGKRSIAQNNRKAATTYLLLTLGLGITFFYFQLESFSAIISSGYYFTGSESNITTSFIYLIVLAHLAHLAGGIIVLLVIIYNHFKLRYGPGQMLGIELAATYWHFVDFLWIYLFLFLYFFR